MRRSAALLAALVTLAPLVWFAQLVRDTPALVVAASVVPALVAAWLTSRVVHARAEPGLMPAAFLAGAVLAAFLSSRTNAHLLAWLTGLVGEPQARLLTPAFGAPLVEEVGKAIALAALVIIRQRALAGVAEGIACGALVGIGFAMTENLGYLTLAALQGGMLGLARGVYLRALIGSLVHATFTASTGAGLGYLRRPGSESTRIVAPVIGLGLAIAQHLAWNALAADAIEDLLCRPVTPGSACPPPSAARLFLAVPGVVAATVGPGLAMLFMLARRSSRASSAAR